MKQTPLPIICLIALVLIASLTAEANWVRQDSKTLAWLRDIYFLNEKKGWIAGSKGEFLATDDGGKTWTKQKLFTQDTIREVHFFDENNGWLLCERDIFTLGADPPSYILNTADGGKTWTTVDFSGDDRKRITRFFFAGDDFGLAIGESGVLLATHGDRSSWKRLPSPVPFLLSDGVFVDKLKGAIVGGGGTILITEDAGVTWQTTFVSGNAKTKLNSVFFLNERTGWTVGENGTIYQTINGGKVWRNQKSGVTANLTDVYFVNTAEGWAVGENGTLLHSTTAGNVWTPFDSKIGHKLEKILFVGKSGWIVGFGGTILFNDGEESPDDSRPQIRAKN